jgi:hypothetical protein
MGSGYGTLFGVQDDWWSEKGTGIDDTTYGDLTQFNTRISAGPEPSYWVYHGGASFDRPAMAPIFTDANAVVCYIIDDVITANVNTAHAGLGGLTKLAYLASKHIPVCFAVVANWLDDAGYVAAADIATWIKANGGCVMTHTSTHTSTHNGLTDPEQIAQLEVDDAIDSIETQTGFRVASGAYNGSWNGPNSGLGDTTHPSYTATQTPVAARHIRQRLIAHRDCINGLNEHSWTIPMAARYPLGGQYWFFNAHVEASGWWTSFLKVLANSKGLVYIMSDHGEYTDANIAIWKERIDVLAEAVGGGSVEHGIPAGSIRMALPHELASMYPIGYVPNKIPNPGFEADELISLNGVYYGAGGDPTAWIAVVTSDGNTVQTINTDHYGGARCCKMVRGATGDCKMEYWKIHLEGERQYKLSFWAKSSVSGKVVTINWYWGAGEASSSANITVTDAWARYTLHISCPKSYERLYVLRFAPAVNQTFYLDDIELV